LPSSSRLRWISGVIVLLLLAGTVAVVVAWRWYDHALPMTVDRTEVRIAPGTSARGVARQLRESGIGVNEDLFVAVARATEATSSLRAGRYEIKRGMTMHQLIDKLRRGEVLRERLTVVEGWTFRDLRAALSAQPDLRQDSAKLSDLDILKAIGASESHPEGLFAPDTYLFDPGSSDIDLLRSAYRAQTERLQQAWARRDATLPLKTPYDALRASAV